MTSNSDSGRLSKRALAQLIRKAMKGDAEAFSKLYKLFFNTIYYNVSNTLFNKSDTEDAVQSVVLLLYKGLPRLKSPYAFHSYLYRITMNVCNEYNQKEARQQLYSQADGEEGAVDTSDVLLDGIVRKQREALVRSFIDQLPEKQRYALLLYYYHDLSYKGIAEAMDTSVTVVGSNINRAKKNIKQMLEEHENKAAEDHKGDKALRGGKLDSVFASAMAITVESASAPGSLEVVWEKCIERAPEIATSTLAAGTQLASLKTLLIAALTTTVVVGGGFLGIKFALDASDDAGITQSSVTTIQQNVFVPEHVSINFVSGYAENSDAITSIHAVIELSEGFPLDWQVKDATGTIVSYGTGSIIQHAVFDALSAGTYTVEWRISNDAGDIGMAYNHITIIN